MKKIVKWTLALGFIFQVSLAQAQSDLTGTIELSMIDTEKQTVTNEEDC